MLASLALAPSLAGCGEEPPVDADLPIGFSRSGGIAGISELMTIDGPYVSVVSGYGTQREKREGTIGPTEIDELETLIDEADLEEIEPEDDSQCADCFSYTIDAGGTRLELSSIDFEQDDHPELDQLVGKLQELLMRFSPNPDA